MNTQVEHAGVCRIPQIQHLTSEPAAADDRSNQIAMKVVVYDLNVVDTICFSTDNRHVNLAHSTRSLGTDATSSSLERA